MYETIFGPTQLYEQWEKGELYSIDMYSTCERMNMSGEVGEESLKARPRFAVWGSMNRCPKLWAT